MIKKNKLVFKLVTGPPTIRRKETLIEQREREGKGTLIQRREREARKPRPTPPTSGRSIIS